MTFLLDTNACIVVLNDESSSVALDLADVPRADVALCAIVKAELYYGAYKSERRQENLTVLGSFFALFRTLPFDDEAAEVYGQIRAKLEADGMLIGPNDLIIAATALRHGVTLVTHNTREFRRVEALDLVDWQR